LVVAGNWLRSLCENGLLCPKLEDLGLEGLELSQTEVDALADLLALGAEHLRVGGSDGGGDGDKDGDEGDGDA
jgi:hypothetical protein